ncbi:MAG: hypothetical protein IJ475_03835 [Bacilli bacterium]|nr:hypothetical protein [Bacilli bacterium]
MNKEAVVVPEKKETIERIKRKYNNLQMSDKTAQNIRRLEITNNVLKVVTAGVGIVAAIDLIIPDPVLGVDEAILTAATGLLGYGTSVVSNKIQDLAATESTDVSMTEINELTNKLASMAGAVAAKKANNNQSMSM